jgi:choline-sulfatase
MSITSTVHRQLRVATIAAGVAITGTTNLPAAGTMPPNRPNILFIIADQMQAGMLSCAGNPYLKTPMMDSLAATGARFALAYCANPVCMPSRFSMMSGVMPSRIKLETNASKKKSMVTPEILANSLGRVFEKAGYETVYGGKVHLPMKIEDAGFKDIEKDEGPKLAKTCMKFLRESHHRPFLMVASFINPHDICYMAISDAPRPGRTSVPQPLVDAMALPAGMSKDEFASKWPPLPANFAVPEGEPEDILAADLREFRVHARNNWTPEQWRLHRWAYARLTELVDKQIGQLLTTLRETGLDTNTLVVFVSDHGDMDASHRLEHKSVFYDEASRVPLIVSWKGVTKPGLVDHEHLISTGQDLIPTLCDFAGIPTPASLKGRSVRALAEGGTLASWRETQVVENGQSRMLRSARYKYVVYAGGARREMLVDMVADPGEMKNLAQDPAFAPVLEEHRRLLKEWYRQNGERLDSKYIASGRAE